MIGSSPEKTSFPQRVSIRLCSIGTNRAANHCMADGTLLEATITALADWEMAARYEGDGALRALALNAGTVRRITRLWIINRISCKAAHFLRTSNECRVRVDVLLKFPFLIFPKRLK